MSMEQGGGHGLGQSKEDGKKSEALMSEVHHSLSGKRKKMRERRYGKDRREIDLIGLWVSLQAQRTALGLGGGLQPYTPP